MQPFAPIKAAVVSDFVAPLNWQPAKTLSPENPMIFTWLNDEASLTRRLRALSQERFSVVPLTETQAVLRPDECHALNLPAESLGWVREVYLCGNNTPWVFARSVAGLNALTQSGFGLESLGQRSLGELLFQDPAFTRGAFSACLYPAQFLPQALSAEPLWARRSCFTQQGLGILVMEAFLPAFWQQLSLGEH